jgi:hypothetical protein
MPRTKPKPKANEHPQGIATAEVLTLAEAAYLRVPEADVLRLIGTPAFPARKIGEEWRFLKAALEDWLRSPGPEAARKDFWATQLGAFKDDPHLDEMLQEIYKRRGRPITEGR